jgi:hypothetical protein
MSKRPLLNDLTEEEVLEIQNILYGMARNTWSLFLLVSELLTGQRFNSHELKQRERDHDGG